MALAIYSRSDVLELLDSQSNGDKDFAPRAMELIDAWHDRGDGCAVYRNEDLGHPLMGTLKFVSFGSAKAQLETKGDFPPSRLPDIGGDINWRYVLIGTYGLRH